MRKEKDDDKYKEEISGEEPKTGWFDFSGGVDISVTPETVYLVSVDEGPKALIPIEDFEQLVMEYKGSRWAKGDNAENDE